MWARWSNTSIWFFVLIKISWSFWVYEFKNSVTVMCTWYFFFCHHTNYKESFSYVMVKTKWREQGNVMAVYLVNLDGLLTAFYCYFGSFGKTQPGASCSSHTVDTMWKITTKLFIIKLNCMLKEKLLIFQWNLKNHDTKLHHLNIYIYKYIYCLVIIWKIKAVKGTDCSFFHLNHNLDERHLK